MNLDFNLNFISSILDILNIDEENKKKIDLEFRTRLVMRYIEIANVSEEDKEKFVKDGDIGFIFKKIQESAKANSNVSLKLQQAVDDAFEEFVKICLSVAKGKEIEQINQYVSEWRKTMDQLAEMTAVLVEQKVQEINKSDEKAKVSLSDK